MNKIPITAGGASRLEEELKNLKSVERPNVIQAIAEARAHGDLSENAEYDAAKERQGYIEARIADLEAKVSRFQIINPQELTGPEIKFGATITVVDEDTEKEFVYQIVGDEEGDVNHGKLAISSPLAKALINKAVGDSVEVNTPRGQKAYEVLKVDYI